MPANDHHESYDVLIVDDDVRFLRTVVPLLVRMDSRLAIQTAHSIDDARRSASRRMPAVLVSELDLPDGSGLDLISHLRDLDPHLPLIVATYEPTSADRVTSAIDAVSTIGKPFFANTLHAMLLEALSHRVHSSVSDDHAGDGDEPTIDEVEPLSFEGFTGAFSGLSMVDVVQFNVMTGKRTALHIHDPTRDQHGWLFFDRGRVVHAACGAVAGREAFFSLLSWDRGNFLPAEYEQLTQETITEDPSHLILEALTYLDEVRSGARDAHPEDTSGETDLSAVSFSGELDIQTLLEKERRIHHEIRQRQIGPEPPHDGERSDAERTSVSRPAARPPLPDGTIVSALQAMKDAEHDLPGFRFSVLLDASGTCHARHGAPGIVVPDELCLEIADTLVHLAVAARLAGAGDPRDLTVSCGAGQLVLSSVEDLYLGTCLDDSGGNVGMVRLVTTQQCKRVAALLRKAGRG